MNLPCFCSALWDAGPFNRIENNAMFFVIMVSIFCMFLLLYGIGFLLYIMCDLTIVINSIIFINWRVGVLENWGVDNMIMFRKICKFFF